MKTSTILTLLALAVACSSGAPPTAPPTAQTVAAPAPGVAPLSEAAIGLAPGGALEQPPQSAVVEVTDDPGSSQLRPRPNADFPPVIPHSLAGLEPITAAANACLDCHDRAAAGDAGAPSAPASHYRDLRNQPDAERDTLAMARHNCTACHVAQTTAPPLVALTR